MRCSSSSSNYNCKPRQPRLLRRMQPPRAPNGGLLPLLHHLLFTEGYFWDWACAALVTLGSFLLVPGHIHVVERPFSDADPSLSFPLRVSNAGAGNAGACVNTPLRAATAPVRVRAAPLHAHTWRPRPSRPPRCLTTCWPCLSLCRPSSSS